LGYGRAGEIADEHTAQGVAQCDAKAFFQGLGDESSEVFRLFGTFDMWD